MLSEVIQGDGNDMRGFSWWGYATGFTSYLPPNSSQPDIMGDSVFCDNDGVNPPCSAPMTSTQPMMMGARSHHPGGVGAAMCDGSMHFFSDNIAINAWRALSTTQGGETVGGDAL